MTIAGLPSKQDIQYDIKTTNVCSRNMDSIEFKMIITNAILKCSLVSSSTIHV